MSWSQHLRSPHEFLKVGDEIEAVILTLDREERKMSLGIKQLKPDPWTNVATKYPVGSKHTSTVKNFQNFGVFVELEEGIDGLVHISDLSWQKKIKHPSEFCKIGDKMEVVVLEVDPESRRLSLGHKQLEDNPWEVFETIFTNDSVHEGTVLKITDKGAIIALPYGIEGFAPMKHLVKENGTSLKVDEKADFKILEFSKENKRILVSHSRLHEEKTSQARNAEMTEKGKEREEGAKAVKKIKDNQEKTTLGDISALSNLKNEMETAEKKTRKKKAEEDEMNGSATDAADVASTEEEKKEE
jgi:small subunit ribosomal protein S1